MNRPMLFRQEVVVARRTERLGRVLLAPQISHHMFVMFAVVATASLFGFLVAGEYPRKTRASGWLMPELGLVQVFAPQQGIITEMRVKEGDEVEKGAPLFTLATELESTAFGATNKEVVRHLVSRRSSLQDERRALERLGEEQVRSLASRLEVIRSERLQSESEIALQASRMGFASTSLARERALRDAGLATADQVLIAEAGKLDQGAKLRSLERGRLAAERDRVAVESERKAIPLKTRVEIANIDRSIAVVEQELAEVEARRESIVSAPASGTVTAMQAERGGRADPHVPLLNIVPAGSKLEAHLFCPSRSIGFLRVGQRVLLRYEAYPYQKFGHYEGTIASVSHSTVGPRELPARLSGLTSVVGSGEPLYRVTVSIARQTAVAYGESLPLQPGMQLEADVVLERRRLVEWMLEPLYTLTGTWKR